MNNQPILTRRNFVSGTALLAGAAALPSVLRAQAARIRRPITLTSKSNLSGRKRRSHPANRARITNPLSL